MPTLVTDTLKQHNNADFPIVMAEDVQISDVDIRSIKKVIEDDYYTKDGVFNKDETTYKIKEMIGSFTGIVSADAGISPDVISNETPVGSVIAHMGTTAPPHYLVCDGSTYPILDYKELADFFEKEFGTCNHFGGDGITTFAVPNLQGEFLRGTGTNSHTNQGSGVSVGVHQDATENLYMGVNQKNNGDLWFQGTTYTGDGTSAFTEKGDTYIWKTNTSGLGSYWRRSGTFTNATGQIFTTSRPTNTSVLYCIKYESTYYLKVAHDDAFVSEYYDNYSTDEVVIGRWIDGKPVYQRYFEKNNFQCVKSTRNVIFSQNINIDTLIDYKILIDYNDKNTVGTINGKQLQMTVPSVYDDTRGSTRINIFGGAFAQLNGNLQIEVRTDELGYFYSNPRGFCRYTKTTDAPDSFTPDMIYKQYSLGFLPATATDEEVDLVFA